MKNLTKLTAAALSALLLTSCGAGGGTQDATSAQSTAPAETVETSVIETLKRSDFKGYKFRILGEQMRDYYFAAEQNGEVINDAVFERNSTVADYFGLTFDFKIDKWGEGDDEIMTLTLAGEDAFDLYATTHLYLGPIITGNCVANWKDIPNVDMSKPWYVASANETYSIGDNVMLLFGDFMESNIRNCYSIVYNKNKAADYKIDGLYQTVRSGGWTVDYFISLTKNIYNDLNGDAKPNEGDFFGFSTDLHGAFDSFSRAFGLSAISKDKNNYPVLDFYNDNTVKAYEKLYELFYDCKGTYPYETAFGHIATVFAAGNAVFGNMMLINVMGDAMRAMEDDYGILPYFKFREEQDKYYTYLDGTFSAQMVPQTQPKENWERTGLVTEALNAMSRELVIPAIYDITLKVKVSRDEESVEMVDLVLAGRAYSFDSLDESNFPFSPNKAIRQLLRSKNKDIASYYASNEASAKKWIENMVAAYEASAK